MIVAFDLKIFVDPKFERIHAQSHDGPIAVVAPGRRQQLSGRLREYIFLIGGLGWFFSILWNLLWRISTSSLTVRKLRCLWSALFVIYQGNAHT